MADYDLLIEAEIKPKPIIKEKVFSFTREHSGTIVARCNGRGQMNWKPDGTSSVFKSQIEDAGFSVEIDYP